MKYTRKFSCLRRTIALAAATMLLAGALPLAPVNAQTKTAARRLSEEQQIAHALNRFAFGARPGDVERVRQIGLDRWLVCTTTLASIPHDFSTRRINHRSIA